jgi:hypothetical protein
MHSKGLRRTSLSANTKFDADDKARKPLKPLLGIGAVVQRLYCFIHLIPISINKVKVVHKNMMPLHPHRLGNQLL